jgi:hypothetical protein
MTMAGIISKQVVKAALCGQWAVLRYAGIGNLQLRKPGTQPRGRIASFDFTYATFNK